MSGPNSAKIIANMLETQGFTSATANTVRRYWLKHIAKPHRLKQIERQREEFSRIMRQLNEADKLLAGKYISVLEKAAFDTGLRIGLTTFAIEKEVE